MHLAGDTAADGEPIFYGGGRLAADLSLTRLRQRWQPDTTLAGTDRRARQLRPTPAEIYHRAAALITDATGHMTANPEAAAGIAAAAADVLTALAAAWEGTAGGPLTRAAELFDRAAHEPTSRRPALAGTPGYSLRAVARILAATGSRREQNELHAMLQLVRAMAGIADAVAELRDAQQRLHQADAARQAAAHLATYQPPQPAAVAATRRLAARGCIEPCCTEPSDPARALTPGLIRRWQTTESTDSGHIVFRRCVLSPVRPGVRVEEVAEPEPPRDPQRRSATIPTSPGR